MAAKRKSNRQPRRESPDARELLVLELQEIHSAEAQLARLLPRLTRFDTRTLERLYEFGAFSYAVMCGGIAAQSIELDVQSTVQTLRTLKPSEYPLAQPYRLKIVQVTDQTRFADYVKNVPVEKYQKEELQLLNGLYPNREPAVGSPVKVVE